MTIPFASAAERSPYSPAVPVLGRVEPWFRDAQWLDYNTGEMIGLARVSPHLERVDVLVIHALNPGHGQGSRFIDALMANYETVVFWQVMSTVLEAMLTKRGFRQVRERILSEWDFGMRWDKGPPLAMRET